MMRIVLISFCFLLCLGENNSITWQNSRKLTWQDFKAKPKAEVEAVASTVSGISFSFTLAQKDSEDYTYKTFVEAHFYPEKSWVKIKDSTNYMLSHEQLHIDITELYARKIRKRISETEFTKNIRSELNMLNDDINNELEIIQNKYDTETNHSIIPERQKKWQTLIEKELAKVLDFSKVNE